jgi:NhaC family Na+:H+ antiporter
VDIFSHIRYMTYTTIPSISIALIIFLIAGFFYGSSDALQVSEFTNGLSATFNISIFTLIVPIITGIMIAKRMPSLVVLFVSSMLAGICAIIFQSDILKEIAASNDIPGALQVVKGLAITFFGATNVETGSDSLNELVSTGGMAGMLNTIWLIMCSMCFGGSMVASRMLESLTNVVLRLVKNRVSLVSSTVGTGIFLNLATGDQSISIILTADMYREVYEKEGYEGRLLSRTTEDAGTVTSVLIPWNTCGMTQSTVLGVPTLTYLPYCFFNLISPFMSIIVAATGWKIRRVKVKSEE